MLKSLNQVRHPKIIEIGSGTGTMLTRLLDSGPPNFSAYAAIDLDPALIDQSQKNIAKWALESETDYHDQIMHIKWELIKLDFITDDIDNFLEQNGNKKNLRSPDCQCLSYLLNIPEILPRLFTMLKGEECSIFQ